MIFHDGRSSGGRDVVVTGGGFGGLPQAPGESRETGRTVAAFPYGPGPHVPCPIPNPAVRPLPTQVPEVG